MSRPAPLGLKFLQSVAAFDDRQAAGLATPCYRAPSPRRWNASSNINSPSAASLAVPSRVPSPIRKAQVDGPKGSLTVGCNITLSANNSPLRSVASPGKFRSSSVTPATHLYGSGAKVDRVSTPRARGKLIVEPIRSESPKPTGIRHISVDREYQGIGLLGPDPNEPIERPTPPPMILKPFRRGVRFVPEPRTEFKPRYSDEEPFRHGKRAIEPFTLEPHPQGLRINISERVKCNQVIDFIGSPAKINNRRGDGTNGTGSFSNYRDVNRSPTFAGWGQRSERNDFNTSIRCNSPHTPSRRSFNILSNAEC